MMIGPLYPCDEEFDYEFWMDGEPMLCGHVAVELWNLPELWRIRRVWIEVSKTRVKDSYHFKLVHDEILRPLDDVPRPAKKYLDRHFGGGISAFPIYAPQVRDHLKSAGIDHGDTFYAAFIYEAEKQG